MRWLKITYVLSRAGAPVLLSATLLGSCSENRTLGASDGGVDHKEAVEVFVLPVPGDGGGVFTQDAPIVPYPNGDASATILGQCVDIDASAGLTFANGQAARVTMEWSEGSSEHAIGKVTLAPEIAGLVVGMPSVDVINASPVDSDKPAITNLRAEKEGFAFDAIWPQGRPKSSCGMVREPSWVFRTTLILQCGGQERIVLSDTVLVLCGEYGTTWASSGDLCDECAVICEMAPSPIVPGKVDDDLPLGSALNVVIRPQVRVGGAVVLLAEHAARDGLSYAWQVSAGSLEHLDRDVVLWRLPSADRKQAQLAQVAVTGDDLGAVASLRWGPLSA